MATGLPVATTWVQPAGIEPSASEVGIRLVEAEQHLGAMDPPEASALLQRMSDAVTVIVHRDETLVSVRSTNHIWSSLTRTGSRRIRRSEQRRAEWS